MKRNPALQSWRRSRAFRLPPEYYPEGQPVHLILRIANGLPPVPPQLSRALLRLLSDDSTVVAACLMPDHLHYIAVVEGDLSRQVAGFKSLSTHVAWGFGYSGRLWQRSFYDQVLWQPSQVETVIAYVLENPVRAGLVESAPEWPFSFVRWEG